MIMDNYYSRTAYAQLPVLLQGVEGHLFQSNTNSIKSLLFLFALLGLLSMFVLSSREAVITDLTCGPVHCVER
jgi:hypothetical protein